MIDDAARLDVYTPKVSLHSGGQEPEGERTL